LAPFIVNSIAFDAEHALRFVRERVRHALVARNRGNQVAVSIG